MKLSLPPPQKQITHLWFGRLPPILLQNIESVFVFYWIWSLIFLALQTYSFVLFWALFLLVEPTKRGLLKSFAIEYYEKRASVYGKYSRADQCWTEGPNNPSSSVSDECQPTRIQYELINPTSNQMYFTLVFPRLSLSRLHSLGTGVWEERD